MTTAFNTALEQIRAVNFVDYIEKLGWTKTNKSYPDIRVFRKRSINGEIVLPIDRSLTEYVSLMKRAVHSLAEFENVSAESLIEIFVFSLSDRLEISLSSRSAHTDAGFIPLRFAPTYISSCQKLLLASACSIEDPESRHFSKLSRPLAKNFLEKCHLRTTEGSFVVNILCPLKAIDNEDWESEHWKDQHGTPLTFSQAAVKNALLSVRSVIMYVDSGDESYLEADGAKITSNLCEAIISLFPSSDDAKIRISGKDTFGQSLLDDRGIFLSNSYVEDISDLAAKLSPMLEPKKSAFAGFISELCGDSVPDSKPKGDVEISIHLEDDSIVKARANLGVRDYEIAMHAHGSGRAVSFIGILHRGKRIHKVEDIQEFEILSGRRSD
jgi:hypothetical protein